MRSYAVALSALAVVVLFGSCKKTSPEAPNIPITNPIVRLTYFYIGSYSGDPINMPGTHELRQAVSADGINFGDAKSIYTYNGALADPDIFKIGTGQYGILGTIFGSSSSKLVYATSATVDGTFTTSGDVTSPGSFTGQPATLKYNGALKTYTSGLSIGDFNPATRDYTNVKQVITNANVTGSTSSGICADPSIAKLADGRYIMIFTYSEIGSNPSAKKIYEIISSDPTSFTGKATFLRDAAAVATITRVGTKLYLYYCDATGNNNIHIVAGISSDNGTNWTWSDTQLNGQLFTTGVDPVVMPVDETNLD
jgi:hypothetical protein